MSVSAASIITATLVARIILASPCLRQDARAAPIWQRLHEVAHRDLWLATCGSGYARQSLRTMAPELPADIEAEVITQVSRIVHASRCNPMVTAECVEAVGGTSGDGDLPAQRVSDGGS